MFDVKTVITLPRNCYSGVPRDFDCPDKELRIEKLYITNQFKAKRTTEVEELLSNKNSKVYINLKAKKNLMVDTPLLSGEVQALSCTHYIFTYYDCSENYYMSVNDFFLMKNRGLTCDMFYNNGVDLIESALDFDLINGDDLIKLTMKYISSSGFFNPNWTHASNCIGAVKYCGMRVPTDKTVFHLQEVLPYAKNRAITLDEANKLKVLLTQESNDKVAVTLMNTFNPASSFVELVCLVNKTSMDITRRLKGVPVLPLLHAAYGINTRAYRNADYIIHEYERFFGPASNEILERIADNYCNQDLEESSVFEFKLKVKKR